jgi:hypothetical protein
MNSRRRGFTSPSAKDPYERLSLRIDEAAKYEIQLSGDEKIQRVRVALWGDSAALDKGTEESSIPHSSVSPFEAERKAGA